MARRLPTPKNRNTAVPGGAFHCESLRRRREHFALLTRLRRMQESNSPMCDPLRAGVLDFIDRWLPVSIPVEPTDAATGHPAPHCFSGEQLRARILDATQAVRRSGQKGLALHNAIQRRVAAMGMEFGFRGVLESAICLPVRGGSGGAVECGNHGAASGTRRCRVDVAWALRRDVAAVFEIDSTVKAHSFDKLMAAAAPFKCWIYFGPNRWAFKEFVRRNDPVGEILSVAAPHGFTPSGAAEHFRERAAV